LALKDHGLRSRVKVAFAGGVQLGDIEQLAEIGIDIVDIGRPIVDAPLLDMRLDVVMFWRRWRYESRLGSNA
jgi:nicotinate-nucleotide pyrophosphorylase